MDDRMKEANDLIVKARQEILEDQNLPKLTAAKLITLLKERGFDGEISEIAVIQADKIYSIQPKPNLFYYFRFSEMYGYLQDILIFYDVYDENDNFETTLSAWCQISRALVHREQFDTFFREFTNAWADEDGQNDSDHFNTETENYQEKEMSDGLQDLISFNKEAQLKKVRYADYIKKIFEDESVVNGTVHVRVGRMPDGLIHVVTMDIGIPNAQQKIDMGFDDTGRLREWTAETFDADGGVDVSKSLFGDEDYEEEDS